MKKILTGNEAVALGACESDARVASAYPEKLLGMASNFLDLPVEQWKMVIENSVPPRFKELNLTAFDVGRSLQ